MNKIKLTALAAAMVAAGLGVSCADTKEPAKGQLMVALQTDMTLPKDVDSVRVEVLSFGSVQFANTYQVGQGALLIPATLALIAGEDPARPVTIRVIALQQGKARMLREVVTTVPADRIASLRVPIQWLCDGSAVETSPGQYGSSCPEGQTCIGGRCAAQQVEAQSLPTFDPAQIFGGGTGSGDGACFDTEGCFGGASLVPVDLLDCSVQQPPGDLRNVALVTRDRQDGICDAKRCYVPLDRDDEVGFREANGRLLLPSRVCELINAGKLEGVTVSTTCPTKTGALPPCGPWTSAGKAPQKPEATLLEACETYLTSVCAHLNRCDLVTWESRGGDRCAERGTVFCEAFLALPGLGTSVASFQQGASSLGSAACGSADSLAIALAVSGKGTLPSGSPCLTDEQCSSSNCSLNDDTDCGVCAPPEPGLPEPFSRQQGESCSPSFQVDCALGLRCSAAGTCEPTRQEGDPCSEQALCAFELSCVQSGGIASATCKRPEIQENKPCQQPSGWVQQAPSCDASKGLSCSQGVCKKLPEVGQSCGDLGGVASSSSLGQCLGGYCTLQGAETPVCKAFLADGAPCQEDDSCLWPATCEAQTCQLPVVEACGPGGSGGASGGGGSGGGGAGGSVDDGDQDGISDAGDNCPLKANPFQEDSDGDQKGNVCDNCPDVANPDQADANKDGQGDACSVEVCGDGLDNDNNGLTDCDDPVCAPTCGGS